MYACFKKVEADEVEVLTEYLLLVEPDQGKSFFAISYQNRSRDWQDICGDENIIEIYSLEVRHDEPSLKERLLRDLSDTPNEADKYIDWDPDWNWNKTKKNKQIRTRLSDRTRPYPIGYPFNYDWDLWEE